MRLSAEQGRLRHRPSCGAGRSVRHRRGARWSSRRRGARCSFARGAGRRPERTCGRGRTRRCGCSTTGPTGRSAPCAIRTGCADEGARFRDAGLRWSKGLDGAASAGGSRRADGLGRTGSHARGPAVPRKAGPLGEGVEPVGPGVPGVGDVPAGGRRLRAHACRRGGVPGRARCVARPAGRGGRREHRAARGGRLGRGRSSTRVRGTCTSGTGKTSSGCGSPAGRCTRCRPSADGEREDAPPVVRSHPGGDAATGDFRKGRSALLQENFGSCSVVPSAQLQNNSGTTSEVVPHQQSGADPASEAVHKGPERHFRTTSEVVRNNSRTTSAELPSHAGAYETANGLWPREEGGAGGEGPKPRRQAKASLRGRAGGARSTEPREAYDAGIKRAKR